MKRIKKDDLVVVTTGKSKGHVGKVLRVLGPKVVVEGANLMKKHIKPNPNLQQKGGVVTKEGSVDSSNVAMYNPISKKADKIGFKIIEKDGKSHKVRYFKSNQELVDLV